MGIKDNKNDKNNAIPADRVVFVNLFVVDDAKIDEDEDIVGTIRNLSESADDIASGLDSIVFEMSDADETDDPDDAIWLDEPDDSMPFETPEDDGGEMLIGIGGGDSDTKLLPGTW